MFTLFRKLPFRFWQIGFITIISLLWFDNRAVTPASQAQQPPTEELIPHLALDHYEMDPRIYRQTAAAVPTEPLAPQSYSTWTKIVFASYHDGNWNIYLSNIDGSNLVVLAASGNTEIHPRLNRGGTKVVYATRSNGNYEIALVNPDGTGHQQITSNTTDDVNPVWSPNGQKIAFQSYRDGQAEIYVMNADGSGVTRLTNDPEYDGMPTWSPDGQKIAFTSRRTGSYRIYTMNANGSNLVQRSTKPYSQSPAWSPDGSLIAFSADGNNDGWLETWATVAASTSESQWSTPGSQVDHLVRSWSPDGKQIAFTEVTYVSYQGNWYWTTAKMKALPVVGNDYYFLGPNYSPPLEWDPDWQTMDNQSPVTRVDALPGVSTGPILVSWTGSDAGGSELEYYDVQVKDGVNGTWTLWQSKVTATSALYPGIGGHTYYFRSRGRDHSLNLETWPTTHDTFTQVEASPPVSAVMPLSLFSRKTNFAIRWVGYDPGGSGIAGYDVQSRLGSGGSWQNVLVNTLETFTPFTGNAGSTYYFQVRGEDNAQNLEAWPAGNGDTATTLYTWGVTGQAMNNAGVPVTGVQVTTVPATFAVQNSSLDGSYGAYVSTSASNYTAVWGKTGYGNLPQTSFAAAQDGRVDVVLPPVDNVVLNGDLEAGSFANWTLGGATSPSLSTTTLHTGQYAAALGSTTPFATPQNLTTTYTTPTDAQTDGNGGLHILYQQDFQLYYRFRSASGTWASPYFLTNTNNSNIRPQMIVTTNGTVHVVWNITGNAPTESRVYYAKRNNTGSWNATQTLAAGSSNTRITLGSLALGNDGKAHVSYVSSPRLYYIYQTGTGNNWSSPQSVYQISGYLNSFLESKLAVDNQNNAHFVWLEGLQYTSPNDYKLRYGQRQANGTVAFQQLLYTPPQSTHDFILKPILVDNAGTVHVTWEENADFGYEALLKHISGIGSTWIEPELIALGWQADFVLNESNQLVAIWVEIDQNQNETLYHATRLETGWTNPEIVYLDPMITASVRSIQLHLDDSGTYHATFALFSWGGDGEAVYLQRQPGQGWTVPTMLQGVVGDVAEVVSILDQQNVPHVIWNRTINPIGLVYTTWPKVTQTQDTAMSQSFTLPMTMTTPVLSFLYNINGSATDSSTVLQAKVQNSSGNVTTLLSTSANTVNWQQVWFDMSAWAGQTVTVTLNLHLVAGQLWPRVYVDDITLGSTQPDVWAGNYDGTAIPGEPVTYALSYGNQGAAAATGVILTHTLPANTTFVSATVPPTNINGSTLVWQVGSVAAANSSTIQVTVAVSPSAPYFTTLTGSSSIQTTNGELETANNQASIQLYLAHKLYMPTMAK